VAPAARGRARVTRIPTVAGGRSHPRLGRRRLAAGTALAAALVLAPAGLACGGSRQPVVANPNPVVTTTRSEAPGGPTPGGPTPGGPTPGGPTVAPAAAPARVADPVRLRVPDIAVTAPVVPLRLDAAGALIPPTGFTEVGWNQAGPEPGDDGVAVIAGHVDSKTGPAVFYRLRDLRPGEKVFVERKDGTTATFIVDRLAEYAKADFPDQEVYHSGSGAQLRLITCGGAFNHGTGHYVDNVVIFAHLDLA